MGFARINADRFILFIGFQAADGRAQTSLRPGVYHGARATEFGLHPLFLNGEFLLPLVNYPDSLRRCCGTTGCKARP